MQYRPSSIIRLTPRTCPSIRLSRLREVCASQIAASSDQHVHHATSDSGAEELPDCPHLDCAGDCGPQSFVRLLDRDATQKLSIKFDGFDDFEIDGAFS